MTEQKLLLFRKWDTTEIVINDIGLKTAISLKQIIIPLDLVALHLNDSIKAMLILLKD